MKLSAILLSVALFVSASVANAATPSQQTGGQPSSTQQAADETTNAMPAGEAPAAAPAAAPAGAPAGKVAPKGKDMKDAPKGNQMAPAGNQVAPAGN